MSTRDKQIVIRATAAERDQWEEWARQRGLTVADLCRTAVAAYVAGDAGVPFAARCPRGARHRPGHVCPACGGSTRRAA